MAAYLRGRDGRAERAEEAPDVGGQLVRAGVCAVVPGHDSVGSVIGSERLLGRPSRGGKPTQEIVDVILRDPSGKRLDHEDSSDWNGMNSSTIADQIVPFRW